MLELELNLDGLLNLGLLVLLPLLIDCWELFAFIFLLEESPLLMPLADIVLF
jgi:hypothetical protein